MKKSGGKKAAPVLRLIPGRNGPVKPKKMKLPTDHPEGQPFKITTTSYLMAGIAERAAKNREWFEMIAKG